METLPPGMILLTSRRPGRAGLSPASRLDRTLAIKVLSSALASNADVKARLEREARAISGLKHPTSAACMNIGHHAGTDFLVMEYLEGEHTIGPFVKRERTWW